MRREMNTYYNWLRTRWCDFLAVIYLLFIYYTTLTPFSFVLDVQKIRKNFGQIEWIPYILRLDFYSGSDIVNNLLLFVPLGIILAERQRWKGIDRFSPAIWFKIAMNGFLVSLSVEFIQNFTYDRFSQTSDIVNNTLGALLGAWLLQVGGRRFREQAKNWLTRVFAGKPEMLIAAAFFLFMTALQLAPFEFKMDVAKILDRAEMFARHPFLVDDAFWGATAASFCLAFAASFFCFAGIRRYLDPRIFQRGNLRAHLGIWSASLGLETLQFVMVDSRHSLMDVLVFAAGAALGWLIARRLAARQPAGADETEPGRVYLSVLFWLGVGYFAFNLYLLWASLEITFDPIVINSKLLYAVHPFWWLRQINRVKMISDLFGITANLFFFTLWLQIARERRFPHLRRPLLFRFAALVLLGLFGLRFIQLEAVPHWSQLVAGGMGIYTGKIGFELFKFLLSDQYKDRILAP